MPGLLWRKAPLPCNFSDMTIVVTHDDGGGFFGSGLLNLINHVSEEGVTLEAAQEDSFCIDSV